MQKSTEFYSPRIYKQKERKVETTNDETRAYEGNKHDKESSNSKNFGDKSVEGFS